LTPSLRKTPIDPSFCDNEDYMIPRVENLSAYKAYASGLELNDDPSVFGMHQNANVTYQAQETDKLIATIMNINPNVLSGGDEGATDRFVTEFCEKLLSPEEGIPALIKFDEVKFELNVLSDKGLKPSLTTVLYQEADRFNILLTVARDSLEKLKAAIDGTAIMSATLDNVYKSMLDNVVPKVWTENAYPCLMPLTSWVRDLIKRVKFFQKWVKEGNPTDFWLPGFFFPQGLLTGILQTFSRQHAVAIDKLAFDFRVVDTEKMNTDLPPEVADCLTPGRRGLHFRALHGGRSLGQAPQIAG
jgi:dynein heavy chain